jgi:hypothetical protein
MGDGEKGHLRLGRMKSGGFAGGPFAIFAPLMPSAPHYQISGH